MFRFLRFLIRVYLRLIARIEIEGLDALPETGNYIIAANHLGRLDTAVLLYALDREDIIMPVAEKYKNHPLFGPMGRSVDAIWLNRFEADFHALRVILERMKRGGLLVIAPEGTRSKTASMQLGKPGVAFLASKSGYPIIPVAVTGTEDQGIKSNLKRLRRSVIKVRAGKPYQIEIPPGRGREEALRLQTDELMCRIGAMLPESYRGVYAEHPRLKELLENA